MEWSRFSIHVIDFEGSRKSGVLEYGAVSLCGGEITRTCTRLCRACGPVAPDEARCHGLRAEPLEGQPPFADDFSVFRDLRRTGLLAAHNAAVERRLLCDAWPHPGAVPDFCADDAEVAVADWAPWLDSCALYRRLYPRLANYSLGALLETFSLTQELSALAQTHCPSGRKQPHCALYDALGAALLFKRLQNEADVRALSIRQMTSLADPFACPPPEQSAFL